MVNEQYSMIEKVRANAGTELSEIGESALQAFFDLPGSGDWSPDPHLPIQMFDPFNFGLPFALIGNEKSADELKKKIGREIANGNYPDRADLGEVHAGALLSNFGADVEFIMPRKDLKTPDIRASWPPDDLLDVLYSAGNLFTFFGRKETVGPLTVLEGMYAENLILASNEAGPLELVEDGKSGFLVGPDNVKEIRRLMIKSYDMFHNNRKKYDNMTKYSAKRVKNNFSFESCYEGFKKAVRIN